ncbi:MAG: DHH family phosphoesterase [Leadbetterella sp.]
MRVFFTEDIDQLTSFKNILKEAKSILVTSHQNPDGDAFGSALGLTHYLKMNTGAKVQFISPTEYANFLAWMPGVNSMKVFSQEHHVSIIENADVIFCCDFSSADRLKDMKDAVLNAKGIKVVIDHHENPESFADYLFWDVNASSACELVYKFIQKLESEDSINSNIATCIYTGLLTDTGLFRFNSTTAEVHTIVSHLITKGIQVSEIHRKLFDQNNIERLKMLGYVLNKKMVHLPEFRTIYFWLTEEELKSFNSRTGDTEGIVNYGLSVENIAMSVIFTEKDNLVKISFRSIHDFSVAELSRDHFQGGGHKNAAGGRSEQNMEETIKKFLNLLPNYKEKLLNQAK